MTFRGLNPEQFYQDKLLIFLISNARKNWRKVLEHVCTKNEPLRQLVIGLGLELSESTQKPPSQLRYKFGRTRRSGKHKAPVILAEVKIIPHPDIELTLLKKGRCRFPS